MFVAVLERLIRIVKPLLSLGRDLRRLETGFIGMFYEGTLTAVNAYGDNEFCRHSVRIAPAKIYLFWR